MCDCVCDRVCACVLCMCGHCCVSVCVCVCRCCVCLVCLCVTAVCSCVFVCVYVSACSRVTQRKSATEKRPSTTHFVHERRNIYTYEVYWYFVLGGGGGLE